MSRDNRAEVLRIRCSGRGSARPSHELLSALSSAFDIEFFEADPDLGSSRDPLIWFGTADELALATIHAERLLIIPLEQPAEGAEVHSVEIAGEISGKPWMKGNRLKLAEPRRILPMAMEGASVLMRAPAGAVWLRISTANQTVDLAGLALPAPRLGQAVFEWFNAATFPLWLPLVQFVREVRSDDKWQSTIKACFMFDDPNLHAARYGYIDYASLAEHGCRHGYHTSFATIPFDGWYVSDTSAALFREHRQQLSLLVHGNNHVFRELAQDYSPEQRQALVAQAIRRIQQIEQRAGVEICRVMAAPHGACREAMMEVMARFGFEAASISPGSLRRHNGDCAWASIVGSRPAEIIGGLPVFSRFLMAKDISQDSLFAAFLDQPIIPMGHHEDVAGGLGAMEAMAGQIMRLGPIQWMRMSDISRNHFQWRLDSGVYSVRPHTRRCKVVVPPDANWLRLVASTRDLHCPREWKMGRVGSAGVTNLDLGEASVVEPGEILSIEAAGRVRLDPGAVEAPPWRLKPVLRRLACEARERLRPVLQRR